MSKPIDAKVVTLCQKLNITLSHATFAKQDCYNNVEKLLQEYAPSTSEDYIWRLYRYLSQIPNFPQHMLLKYHMLLMHYKALYTQKK